MVQTFWGEYNRVIASTSEYKKAIKEPRECPIKMKFLLLIVRYGIKGVRIIGRLKIKSLEVKMRF